ncbi:hypothetical protein G4B88_003238 [Cannabis sativa]|uniref:RNase H type-1 domain-containing protein n=1 Tax=Cannabis sativa TaxID=3483 RepID=A0A7J6I421_CANSA|nr:hypothetical protein G4B88_003238 [Cannabis sativa]
MDPVARIRGVSKDHGRSPCQGSHTEDCVRSFLTVSRGVESAVCVCYLFGESLGMQITSIEIVGDLGKDRLVWKRTPSGCFSAKEAYWADLEHRFGEAQKVWKLIWSSRIHPRAAESSLHIFFECSLTRSVWNSRLFGGKCRDSLSLPVEVRKKFKEFDWITSLAATKVPQQVIQFVHRAAFNSKILVTDGSFKDGCCGLAAVGIERNTSAWSYVCRSSEGISALDAELKAIAMALQWVAGQGWNAVTLFSDCLVAVNALNNSRLPDWKLAAGFSNILKFVKSFDQCFFCFAKRDCITGVNDLAFRARTGNVMDLCCLGEGLPLSILCCLVKSNELMFSFKKLILVYIVSPYHPPICIDTAQPNYPSGK